MGYHHPQTPAQSPHHPAAQSMTTLGGRLGVALGTSTEYQVCVNVLSIHLYRTTISLSPCVDMCNRYIYIYTTQRNTILNVMWLAFLKGAKRLNERCKRMQESIWMLFSSKSGCLTFFVCWIHARCQKGKLSQPGWSNMQQRGRTDRQNADGGTDRQD